MHFRIEHQHLNVFTTAQDDSIQFITFYSNFYIPLKFFNVMNETSEEVSINFYCLCNNSCQFLSRQRREHNQQWRYPQCRLWSCSCLSAKQSLENYILSRLQPGTSQQVGLCWQQGQRGNLRGKAASRCWTETEQLAKWRRPQPYQRLNRLKLPYQLLNPLIQILDFGLQFRNILIQIQYTPIMTAVCSRGTYYWILISAHCWSQVFHR